MDEKEKQPIQLTEKEREELIQKALNHPRLKQFVHATHPSGFYEFFKRWIFPGPIIGFIRAFMVAFLFWLHYFVQWLIFFGVKDFSKPAKFRRKLSHIAIRILARGMLLFAAFHWVEYVDHTRKRPKSKNPEDLPRYEWDQPWPNVTPHATPFDIISLGCYLGAPSFAAKDETSKLPMVHFLLKAFRCIIVYRDKKMVKDKSTLETMQDRIAHPCEGEYAPLIFAEGTTDNGEYLLRFHTGAFLAGVPVRPMAVHYPHKRKSLNWESVTFQELLPDMFTQFHNRFRIEVLDLYLPSEAEKKDPQLYADNVGRLIANHLGIKYAPEVDMREKKIYLALIRGYMRWEEVEGELSKIDNERAQKRAGEQKERE